MFQKGIVPFFLSLGRLIHNPKRIFYVGLVLMFLSLVVDGTLWRLWGLKSEIHSSRTEVQQLKLKTTKIIEKIKKAQTSEFIEKEARRRFELASEGDLIFVFSRSANRQD